MAQGTSGNDLTRANFRRCIVCTWPNFIGLGFNLENSPTPPHLIRTVESNSPASAAGLKILDLVLAVNNQDVSNVDYKTVTQAIKNARDTQNQIDLLVIEKRFYEGLKARGVTFDPQYAKVLQTPKVMPNDYKNFPKYTPRTCDIHLNKQDQSFGFEIVNGMNDVGAFIQEVLPNTPASQTSLRKSDRILEIDGKFVDTEPSRNITDKLIKAKKKRTIKLYVVDTNTYKYFQENQIPLTSKEFRKSTFSKQQQQQQQQSPTPTPYINVEDIPTETRSPDVDSPGPFFPPQTASTTVTTRENQSTIISDTSSIQDSSSDDIRLCTITRTNATDTYGMELNYHRRDQYHSLKIPPFRANNLSNAAQAGIKTDDHLIEINGENIERMSDELVQQRIRSVKYPQPLQLLVADTATYNRYKQQGKTIHSGLPSVKQLPESTTVQRTTSVISTRQQRSFRELSTISSMPVDEPAPGINALANQAPIEPRSSTMSSLSNGQRRRYQLYRMPNFQGFGFSVNSNQAGAIAHRITQIASNSPAALQGLRVGDYIVSVNDQNVEKMTASDFNQYLRTAAQNSDINGNPLVLEVINEDSYQLPISPDSTSLRSNNRPSTTISPQENSETQDLSHYITNPSRLSRVDSNKSSTTTPAILQLVKPSPTIIPSETSSRTPTISKPDPTANERKKSIYDQQIPVHDDSVPVPQLPQNTFRRESQKSSLPRKPTTTQSMTNGYGSSPYHQPYSPVDHKSNQLSPVSYFRSRENLSRGAVDIVSDNRLLRYCRLTTEPNQSFGFQLNLNENGHIIYNLQPNLPAARAGLNEGDRLIEIDYENVENKSSGEVAQLIRSAAQIGILRLLVSPHDIKVLSKRSAKSITSLNDSRHYRSTLRSRYDERDYNSSPSSRNRSIPRHYSSQTNRSRSYLPNDASFYSSEPTDPLPRKCVVQHDPSFRGCGFRLIENENYDTPIITEIASNSPAKRSGLTEGDHIIYIESYNIQNFRSFNEITSLIQRIFEENGQVSLIALTGSAYRVLKRRGGYLESLVFDYQSRSSEQLKPRLYHLNLSLSDYDFGFTLQRYDFVFIKHIQENSLADSIGLKTDDIILEINGQIVKYLTTQQIKEIIETSKHNGRLDLLVIDFDGYQYSIKHAIPLNSLLLFVQVINEQRMITNNRLQYEAVYL